MTCSALQMFDASTFSIEKYNRLSSLNREEKDRWYWFEKPHENRQKGDFHYFGISNAFMFGLKCKAMRNDVSLHRKEFLSNNSILTCESDSDIFSSTDELEILF